MSAAEHREAAQEHHTEADQAGVHVAGGSAQSDTVAEHDESTAHDQEAEQHEEAANALDAQRAAACEGIADEDARSCAFHGNVSAVRDVDNGVTFTIRGAGMDAAAVEHRATCHYAHMSQQGLDSMAACPFGVRDLTIHASDAARGNVSLAVTTSDSSLVPELRRRAHAMATAPHAH